MSCWASRIGSGARRRPRGRWPLAERTPTSAATWKRSPPSTERLVDAPPQTFREACQWIAWYQMAARMYNGNGSIGRLDMLLHPYYRRDVAAGRLDDEEAIYILACLFLKETGYIQLGGPDADGRDATNPVSFLCLEAAHRLRMPVNIGIAVGEQADPRLLRRGVEIICADRAGMPKFVGVENAIRGYQRNGIPPEVARLRSFAGCHHFALPGREYTLATGSTLNLAAILDVAVREMDPDTATVEALWERFQHHLGRAVELVGDSLAFHMRHMHEVFPELMVDLCSHGPLEKGLDCSQPGGLEYVNKAVDAVGLATVADSFAALEQRVERERRLTWAELLHWLDGDWAGPEGERARLMMRHIPRYGSGGSPADAWAQRVAVTFAEIVRATKTPLGHDMIPGLYSWLGNIEGGAGLGRHAQRPPRARAPLAWGQPRPGLSPGRRANRPLAGHHLRGAWLGQHGDDATGPRCERPGPRADGGARHGADPRAHGRRGHVDQPEHHGQGAGPGRARASRALPGPDRARHGVQRVLVQPKPGTT